MRTKSRNKLPTLLSKFVECSDDWFVRYDIRAAIRPHDLRDAIVRYRYIAVLPFWIVGMYSWCVFLCHAAILPPGTAERSFRPPFA